MTNGADNGITRAELERIDANARWVDGGRVHCLCPFPPCAGHTRVPEHRSFSLDTATGLYKCHRCQATGKLRDYWEERPAVSQAKRRKAAALRAIVAPPPAMEPPPGEDERTPPAETQVEYTAAFPGSPAAEYLASRGVPADVAAAHGCGYTANWAGVPRVTFPIRDAGGGLVALNGRACAPCPDGLKQRTTGPKARGVFCPDALAGDVVLLTEAPIDALSLAACGYPAVALMGTTWPAWLPSVLVARNVYLATDADAAGDTAADKLNAAIRLSRCARLRPPDGHKDWNAALLKLGRDALTVWLAEHIPHPVPAAATATTVDDDALAGPLSVYSVALGESVLVVETAARLPAPVAGEPVTYTRVELALLAGQPADVLRNAHLLKRVFGGFCVGVPDAELALS